MQLYHGRPRSHMRAEHTLVADVASIPKPIRPRKSIAVGEKKSTGDGSWVSFALLQYKIAAGPSPNHKNITQILTIIRIQLHTLQTRSM